MIYLTHSLVEQDCGVKLPSDVSVPLVRFSFYIAVLAIKTDSALFAGVKRFTLYTEQLLELLLVSKQDFAEVFVVKNGYFNADS